MSEDRTIPEAGTALPSHLTPAQAARHMGVSPQAIGARLETGSLPSEVILGTRMVPSMALLEHPSSASQPAAYAFPPSLVIDTAWDALTQLAEDPDRPMFSARQLLGVYLGLSRLPYPPPAK